MATLTADQLTDLRQACANGQAIPVNYTKPQINAALQAIEDWMEANKASLSQAINTATDPFVFTAAQKKELGRYWFKQKFERGG